LYIHDNEIALKLSLTTKGECFYCSMQKDLRTYMTNNTTKMHAI